MSTPRPAVHLFEYGGGIVVGTDDIDLARALMRERIREEFENFAPVPWQMYDFTWREPSVERGRVMEDPSDLNYAQWMHDDNGVPAVRWR